MTNTKNDSQQEEVLPSEQWDQMANWETSRPESTTRTTTTTTTAVAAGFAPLPPTLRNPYVWVDSAQYCVDLDLHLPIPCPRVYHDIYYKPNSAQKVPLIHHVDNALSYNYFNYNFTRNPHLLGSFSPLLPLPLLLPLPPLTIDPTLQTTPIKSSGHRGQSRPLPSHALPRPPLALSRPGPYQEGLPLRPHLVPSPFGSSSPSQFRLIGTNIRLHDLSEVDANPNKLFTKWGHWFVEINDELIRNICPADLNDVPCEFDVLQGGCPFLRLCETRRKFAHPHLGNYYTAYKDVEPTAARSSTPALPSTAASFSRRSSANETQNGSGNGHETNESFDDDHNKNNNNNDNDGMSDQHRNDKHDDEDEDDDMTWCNGHSNDESRTQCPFIHGVRPTCRHLAKQLTLPPQLQFRSWQMCPHVHGPPDDRPGSSPGRGICRWGHDLESVRAHAVTRYWEHRAHARRCGVVEERTEHEAEGGWERGGGVRGGRAKGLARRDVKGKKVWNVVFPKTSQSRSWSS